MITTKYHGYEFFNFIKINENDINTYHPVAGSFDVLKCKGKFLLCFNTWRKQWELPAGQREGDETPKECALRELYEETGQIVKDLEFLGLLKVRNITNGNIKFNPVYYTTMDKLQPFLENEETSHIMLWSFDEEISDIDSVEIKLLEYLESVKI